MKINDKNMKNFNTMENTQDSLSNRKEQFQKLVEISAQAKEIKEGLINNAEEQGNNSLALFYSLQPLNYFIINYIYKKDGNTEFKKFREWKQDGAIIKKGAKAFPIWGQPVGTQKEKSAAEKGEEYNATAEEKTRYPICYVFSNQQIVVK
jgi:hypothetical protein